MTKSWIILTKRISLLIVPLLIFNSCSFLDWIVAQKNWTDKVYYIGEHKLNIAKSDFGEYTDTKTYQNLVLTIKDDETFTFSFDLPFITKTQGQWRMAGDDVSSQCELLYGSKYSYDQVHVDKGSIFIENPRGKKDIKKAKLLRFDKVN